MNKNSMLYKQARDTLLDYIRNSNFKNGRLPSEEKLKTEMGFSLSTIREALMMLAWDGYITKLHGSGNYVHRKALELHGRIDLITDYSVLLSEIYPDLHIEQSPYTLLSTKEFQEFCNEQNVWDDSMGIITYIRKYYVQGDQLAIMAKNFLPVDRLNVPVANLPENIGMLNLVPQFCGINIVQNTTKISAINASDEIAEAFGIEKNKALIHWEEEFVDIHDEVICLTKSCFNTDLVDMNLIVNRNKQPIG